MFYSVARRIFVGILALVALIVNARAVPTAKETPPDAVSVVYDDSASGDVKLFLPDPETEGGED